MSYSLAYSGYAVPTPPTPVTGLAALAELGQSALDGRRSANAEATQMNAARRAGLVGNGEPATAAGGGLASMVQRFMPGGSMPNQPGAAPASMMPNASKAVAAGGGGSGNLQGDIASYAKAIQGVESGGRYDVVGPTHAKYGRALGAYQVMEANLPEWSQAALGRTVTPDEFLANPAIQDKIFENRFGGYVQKYGNPQDAASAWLTGKPRSAGNTAKDVFGTDSNAYVSKFNAGLGPSAQQAAPVQVASTDPNFMPAAKPAFQGMQSDAPGPIYDDKGLRMGSVPQPAYPGATPYAGPGASTRMPAVYGEQGGAPVADLNAGLPPIARPVEMPAGPLPEADATALPMLPAPQTVAASPVPPQQPQFSPQVSSAMAADPGFDGFARSGGNVQGAPAVPGMGAPQAQPASGVMGLIQSVGLGETTGTNFTEDEFRSLLRAPETRELALSLWKSKVTGDPGAQAKAIELALKLDEAQYKRSRDGVTDRQWQAEFDERSGGTVPSGYRRTSNGLEPIPGGPNDPAGPFKPDLESVYDDQGRERKGYFDRAGKWIDVGGSKAPPANNGGITVGPDGTVQIGGYGKPPSGFMPDPADPSRLTPIPGGPGEQISGELAARLGLADEFLKQAPALKKKLEAGDVSGPYDVFQARNNQSSEPAQVHRELEFGVEALVRMLTGAGMNASEADERARRYLPTYTDDAGSMAAKLDGLTEYLTATKAAAMRGRGGPPGGLDSNAPNTGGGSPTANPSSSSDPLGLR